MKFLYSYVYALEMNILLCECDYAILTPYRTYKPNISEAFRGVHKRILLEGFTI